jgi:hypothetical protein
MPDSDSVSIASRAHVTLVECAIAIGRKDREITKKNKDMTLDSYQIRHRSCGIIKVPYDRCGDVAESTASQWPRPIFPQPVDVSHSGTAVTCLR